jgi:hypothetical protein
VRRGISIIEVLMSIGIILLGLLGVAAMLPVGRFEIVEAAKQDRAAACGRAAASDAQARGMFDPTVWFGANPSTGNLSPLAQLYCAIGSQSLSSYPDYADTYCIDPLYIAYNTTYASGNFIIPVGARLFPYMDANLSSYMTDAPRMLRVTLAAVTGTDPTVHRKVFDRIFTWPDEQDFNIPADPQLRPTRPVDSAGNTLVTNQGNYAWLATVTPVKRMPDWFVKDTDYPDNQDKGVAYYSADATRQFTASVVVFYKRDYAAPAGALEPTRPAERIVSVEAIGGAGFRLRIPTSAMGQTEAQDYLSVRENDWLMLCGSEMFNYGQNSSGNPYRLWRTVFQWYRVIALSDVGSYTSSGTKYYYRDVTLVGPDWPAAPAQGNPPNPGTYLTHAALFTGVIGVYTVPVTNR